MRKQCLDISQMQHLKELGVDTRTASLCWVCLLSEPYLSFYDKEYPQEDTKVIPAFTLQDILDLLPQETSPQGTGYSLYIDYQEMRIAYCFVDRDGMCWLEPTFDLRDNELIDAAYEMLCWVVENGYLEVKQLNKRL